MPWPSPCHGAVPVLVPHAAHVLPGDSRAVMARNGQVVALSEDHTTTREDEVARIEAAGGRIVQNSGARVMGVLGMTRAIGDTWLRQYGVIPEPDVVVLDRTPLDEFIVVASDGLWGSISSEVSDLEQPATLPCPCLLRTGILYNIKTLPSRS